MTLRKLTRTFAISMLFSLAATYVLALGASVAYRSNRATVKSRNDNNSSSSTAGNWENLFMIGQIEIDGRERHFISQIFRACYPEYSRGRFEEGFNEVMKRYCSSSPKCRVVYTSEVAGSDDEQVKGYHREWASKGYQELYYSEPESIYYRSCR